MSLLTPALAPHEVVADDTPRKFPFRRASDGLIMRRMAWTCLLLAGLNLLFALLVFNPFGLTPTETLMGGFWDQQKERMGFVFFLSLSLTFMIYHSLQSKRLLADVQRIARERDQERERNSRAGVTSDESPLEALMEEGIAYSRAFLPASIGVDCVHKDRGLQVYVDSSAFLQIMNNLLANAALAMDFKGVIHIRTSLFRFSDRGEAKGLRHHRTYVKVEVTDRGHGIPPENLGKIFDPCFTTKKTARGTGLGLAIVYGMVRNMGGAIDVTSKVGKGTTFTLLLPNTKEEQPASF